MDGRYDEGDREVQTGHPVLRPTVFLHHQPRRRTAEDQALSCAEEGIEAHGRE